MVWQIVLGFLVGLVLLWVVLVVLLWRAKPDDARLSEALSLVPDVLRLVRGLVTDPDVPRGVRLRVGLLLAWLISPVDLLPEFLPIGYLDDAIVTVIALRSIMRRAGPEALARHWSGTPGGLRVVRRLAGLPPSSEEHDGASPA